MDDTAVYCPHCGSDTQKPLETATLNPEYQTGASSSSGEAHGLAVAAVICSLLVSFVGLILSPVGIFVCHEPGDRKLCVVGIVFSVMKIVFLIAAFLIFSGFISFFSEICHSTF
jgi:hypothetical protein